LNNNKTINIYQKIRDMTEDDRIIELESIQKEMDPLNYNRIFLETRLYFARERYLKDFNEKDKLIINELDSELKVIYDKLSPLFLKLRSLQCKYIIEYNGELTNPETNSKYWKRENEVFYLKTSCDIDTWLNGWDIYLQDSYLNDLTIELHDIIYHLRYSNFEILNIKRL